MRHTDWTNEYVCVVSVVLVNAFEFDWNQMNCIWIRRYK